MRKSTVATAVMSLSLAGVTFSAPKWAKSGSTVVKCQGVAKKGANDCGANGHSCAGKAAKDNDPNEWVFTPASVCKKIGGKAGKKMVVK